MFVGRGHTAVRGSLIAVVSRTKLIAAKGHPTNKAHKGTLRLQGKKAAREASMAESNGKKRALVVIDSDDDEAPLAPWGRTGSDQAEVADIIEIKDEEEEDDDDLFEKADGSFTPGR